MTAANKIVLSLLLATCVTAYDDGVKACWDIRITDETFFCYGAVSDDFGEAFVLISLWVIG